MIYEHLTASQIAEIDREHTLVVIPIAAIEQHGPHLPTGTDTILCRAVADALEQNLPDQILRTPTLWLGASSHHLRFGSTLNSDLSTYIATLCDTAESLLNDDFKRILFLNGHGGNVDPMKIAVRQLQPRYLDALIAAGCYWSVADSERESILSGAHKFVGHACEFETSLMLHLRPDLVDRDQLGNAGELIPDVVEGVYISRDMVQRTQSGFTGRPDLASAEKGKELFEAIVTNLTILTRSLLKTPLGTGYGDFTDS